MRTKTSKRTMSKLLIITILSLPIFGNLLFSQCDNVALNFDGDSDRVWADSGPTLTTFTMSAWFKAPTSGQSGAEHRVMSFYTGTGGTRFEVGLETGGAGDGQVWIYDSEHIDDITYPTNDLHDDTWHKIVVTNDGNKRMIFLDGVFVDSWTAPTADYGVNLYIGGWLIVSSGEFLGDIDEVAIYDVALDSLDIVNDDNCVLYGSEPNLIAYYPLGNGVPDSDNTALTTTPDLAGGFGDGLLEGLTLNGTTSNFICSSNAGIDLTCPPILGECQVDSLVINSGWNSIDETVYSTGTMQGFWILQDAPTNNGIVNLNSPAFNINKHPAWSPPGYNSTYISPFPVPGMNEANINTSIAPYTLRRCFCVENDNSLLSFDIDIHVDNQMQMYLYEEATGTRTFLDEVTNSSSANNFKGAPEHLNIAPITVSVAGTYCLDADLRNDHGGSPMGINITGYVYGATMLEDSCCSNFAYISGYKFRDDDCDGSVSLSDPTIEGYVIELYEAGTLINTATTDANGFYTFQVSPGTYDVKEVLQTDWEYSYPANGEHIGITVEAFDAYEANFGNIFTGPIETETFETSCLSPGDQLNLNWAGQDCNCEITIQYADCGTGVYTPIADVGNTGSYAWTIPDHLSGDYELALMDCDGNLIAYPGCISINDYQINISAIQSACGVYDFSATYENINPNDIINYQWNFGALGGSDQATSSYTFDDAGDFEIKLTIETNTGCILSETIDLNVSQGASDPNCDFCPPNVLGEIDGGDLFIHDDCFGVILQSPNGNCFRLTMSDEGTIQIQQVDCPGEDLPAGNNQH